MLTGFRRLLLQLQSHPDMFMQVKNGRLCKRNLNTVCEEHFACLRMPKIARAAIELAAE